ncbi:hypothetical protein [Ruegeria atlantica]|uniref:hypothetical protein n=1 Tax=Ruegeria atlantica TaxID=81569 RepID=UPI00147DE541|nr:hypothetical protein [Ruegeria atlantica]
MSKIRALIGASFVSIFAVCAHATTINVVEFDQEAYRAMNGSVFEGFEALGGTHGEGEVANGFSTSVGSFSTLGGVGTGGTVSGLEGNTGSMLALRQGHVFGRESTSPDRGSWFLDSNDTWGLNWDVALADGKSFSKLMFAITDASDAGGFLRISAVGVNHELRSGRKLRDGNVRLVTIDFGRPTRAAEVSLANYASEGGEGSFSNDGFSIDGIQVAAVPLPPSLLLLGSAFLGLGIVTRRRRRQITA